MIRAFTKAPSGVAGMVAIALIIVISIAAPIVLANQSATFDILQANQNSSAHHLLGTDRLGRDILVRIVVATRLSIGLAFAATAIGAVIGFSFGAIAAILPPRIRPIALRTIDTLLAFPPILVAIFVGAIIGPGAVGATVGVGIAISFQLARVASTLALSVGGREYIAAAKVIGVKGPRLFFRYVLPNIAETLFVVTSVAISSAIVFVSSLSFLGLGVQAPDFDWGRMLTEGVQAFYITPAAAVAPAVAISLSALAFGFAGEAMARAMNPLLWTVDVGSAAAGLVGRPAEVSAVDQGVTSAPATDGAPMGHDLALEVRDLVVTFPGPAGPVEVVKGISFDVLKGEMVAIVGESGSGKTMTAMAIAQLVPYPGRVEGTVRLEGQTLGQMPETALNKLLGTRLAVVFQDPMASLNPALKIGTQLTEGVETHRRLTHKEAVALAASRLREVNIAVPEEQMERHPHEFSGGMRQRAMIAMGLMTLPGLLIADEPTTALDVTIQAQIMELLDRINEEHGTAIILISHNLALVTQNTDRVLVMYAGRVVEDLTTGQILDNPMHPYTRALLAVVPDMGRPRDDALAYIPGSAPDLANPPSGCPFHPRCAFAVDRCAKSRPPLLTRSDGRRVACWVANQDVQEPAS